jgi:putative endonuclease
MAGGSAPAWVYMLRCADGSLYTGWTVDLERRLREHHSGPRSLCRYTYSRRPVELAAAFPAGTPTEARREEARIKGLTAGAKRSLAAGSPLGSYAARAAAGMERPARSQAKA